MGPIEALRSVFWNYATFDGRASRSEYWWWFGWQWLGGIAFILVIGVVAPRLTMPASTLVFIAIFIPSWAVIVRRIHDTGRSGWWALVVFVPVVGALLLYAFLLPDSEHGPNRWGPPPPGSSYAHPHASATDGAPQHDSGGTDAWGRSD